MMRKISMIACMMIGMVIAPGCMPDNARCVPDDRVSAERGLALKHGIDLISNDDLQVYVAWLKIKFGRRAKPIIRVSVGTDSLEEDEITYWLNWFGSRGMFSSLKDDTLCSLIHGGFEEAVFGENLTETTGACLISTKLADEIFLYGRSWEQFYEIYPNSLGYIRFNRIAFDMARNQALFFVHHKRGQLAGVGLLVLMEKDGNGNWKLIDEYAIMVA
jgi:hypothetical protein